MTIKLPPLPEPNYWSTRDDDTPLFTADQLRTAQREAALMVLEAVADLLCDAINSDLEHGVKWLNENAAKEFKERFPHFSNLPKAIRAMRAELEAS